MFDTRIFRIFFLAGAIAASPWADADWTLTTGDLKTQTVGQISIDAAGVHSTVGTSGGGGGSGPLVKWDQFVSVVRNSSQSVIASRYVLLLDADERLAGSPLGMTAGDLLWQEPALGKVSVPLHRLRGLVLAGGLVVKPPPGGKQDVVTLANGDVVTGILTNCTADTATVQTDAGSTDLALGSVASISFAVTAAPATRPTADPLLRVPPVLRVPTVLRVRLDDASIFSADHLSVAGETCTLCLPGRAEQQSLPLSRVESLEAVDGPVLWLADTPPREQTFTAYFGTLPGEGQPRIGPGANPDAGGHDVLVHARSRLVFDIPAGCSSFQTQFGIAGLGLPPSQGRPWADVVVRVLLDGRVAFEQSHVHIGPPSPVVSLPLGPTKRITLECDFGDGGGVQALLTWINPLLLRSPR